MPIKIADEMEEVAELCASGRYCLVLEHQVICPDTLQVIGFSQSYFGDYATLDEAVRAMPVLETCKMRVVSPPEAPPSRQNVTQDGLPF